MLKDTRLFLNAKPKVTVYSAEVPRRSIVVHLCEIANELPRAHELGLRLFKRNLKALYRQSFLGFGWALLPPLATAVLWILLRGNKVISTAETGISYPVFVLTGTLLWQVFVEAVSAPLNQVTENRAMLAKINIPREGLLISGLYQFLFNMGLKLILLFLIFIFFHQSISLNGLLLAPLGLLSICVAGFSIGLALTPLGMLFKDIDRGLPIGLPFLMYLTPVVYPVDQDGFVGFIMKLNPLSIFITNTRNWLTAQPTEDLCLFGVFFLVFALLFLISLVVYRLAMPMIIERIGA